MENSKKQNEDIERNNTNGRLKDRQDPHLVIHDCQGLGECPKSHSLASYRITNEHEPVTHPHRLIHLLYLVHEVAVSP